MVQKIKTINDVKWRYKTNTFNKANLIFLKQIPFELPTNFIKLLEISDGGYLDYDFKYFDNSFQEVIGDGISVIYGLRVNSYKYDLINAYYKPPEFFPKNLVPFAAGGGSSRICFDYRDNPKTDNPPVVYWNAGATEGKDISFIANNFDEFIQMLEEPE